MIFKLNENYPNWITLLDNNDLIASFGTDNHNGKALGSENIEVMDRQESAWIFC